VAKYKKKKTPTAEPKVSAKTAHTTKSIGTNSQVSTPSSTDTKKLKRVASGTLKLQFAGELILVKNAQK
jgi:hypothetical protein